MQKILNDLKAEGRPSPELHGHLVNLPFKFIAQTTPMGLGIIVLLLLDENKQQIIRTALSETEHAAGAVEYSVKDFHEIIIPADDPKNIIAKAIRDASPQITTNWHLLFTPALSEEEAKFNQAGAGIHCSHVYPFTTQAKKGAMIYSYFVEPTFLTDNQHNFMQDYTQLVSEYINS